MKYHVLENYSNGTCKIETNNIKTAKSEAQKLIRMGYSPAIYLSSDLEKTPVGYFAKRGTIAVATVIAGKWM